MEQREKYRKSCSRFFFCRPFSNFFSSSFRVSQSFCCALKILLNAMRNVILFLLPSTRVENGMQIALKAILYIQVSLVDTCYVFPADLSDPCRSHVCQYGARCIPSSDTRNATCECPLNCPNYGDHTTRSRPVCGTDGLDYNNQCELRRNSCMTKMNISVKYDGYCGKLMKTIHYSIVDGEFRNRMVVSPNKTVFSNKIQFL